MDARAESIEGSGLVHFLDMPKGAKEMEGVVAFFNRVKGYGFLIPDVLGGDVFFHCKEIVGRRFVFEGERVTYEMGDWKGKPCAVQVMPIEAAAELGATRGGEREKEREGDRLSN